tara:strand:+ start:30687 stop:31406 length:720 start_codon:yes stop_codon:yes gene_type:complete
MENSIYLGLSRQMVLQTNMDIVANNIANMNTSGFRGQNPLFEEYMSDPRDADDPLSFVYDYGQYQMTKQGSIEQTGNPFNVALNGPGFMGVQMPGGETAYTRDGNFQKRADGTLVTSSGLPVMSDGGPIVISDNATEINIDEKGVVSDQNGPIAKLMVVEFENVQELEPAGNNLYISKGNSAAATKTKVAQGFLEGSNVEPVVEMSRMIEILRDFQSTQKLLEGEHERLRSAIQKLTQV